MQAIDVIVHMRSTIPRTFLVFKWSGSRIMGYWAQQFKVNRKSETACESNKKESKVSKPESFRKADGTTTHTRPSPS